MAWIHFFNKTVSKSILSPSQAFHHGACLVFLDAFQTDTTRHGHLHRSAVDKLSLLLSQSDQKEDVPCSPVLVDNSSQEVFGIHPFFISKGTVYRCIKQKNINSRKSTQPCGLAGVRLQLAVPPV